MRHAMSFNKRLSVTRLSMTEEFGNDINNFVLKLRDRPIELMANL